MNMAAFWAIDVKIGLLFLTTSGHTAGHRRNKTVLTIF